MTSLRTRLFQAIALIVVLCVGLTLGLSLVLTRRAVDDATLQDVAHQAALIAGRERVAVSPFTYLKPLQPYLARQHEIYRTDASFLPAAAQTLLRHKHAAQGSVTVNGTQYFFGAQPVRNQAFVLLRPKSSTKSQWSPFLRALLIAALAGAALAAVFAFALARRISGPVHRVAEAARSLARGTHPEPVPVEGASELATLAVAFNDLATQLTKAREAERSFLLSVSHELKTPLTAIRGYAEALEDGALEPDEVTAPGLLRVEDTGPGLETADQARAFERFYLHERYGRERPVGTGLGLAIVKELAEAMGGTVEVSSAPGTRTAFTVRLGAPART